MKIKLLFFLFCLSSLNVMGQGTIQRKKKQTTTQATTSKPTQKPAARQTQKPSVKLCDICDKPLSKCDYGGKHPYCQTCGKLKERCEYNGNHPSQQYSTTAVTSTMQTNATPGTQIRASYNNGILTVGNVQYSMVYVQGGTFTMGATSEQGSDAYDDEKPVHSVTLSNYYIGKYEVTQELWEAVMGSNPSKFKGRKKPVECVSWDDCKTFISKLNSLTDKRFRLPAEAEWEYAARGGNKSRGYKYSGSNNLNDVAWYTDNSGSTTHDVGMKSPNELGIYDMSGNVYEWCSDWYGSYSSNSQTNPTGPSSGSYRVNRGGGLFNNARYCRSSIRRTPGYRRNDLGLRLALSE